MYIVFFDICLRSKICLCGDIVNCRLKLLVCHSIICHVFFQIRQHKFSKAKKTVNKLSAPGYCPFKDFSDLY